ncbi:MAG: hypothetical protein ACI9ME_000531, partial [Ilumatobacter sp.]
MTDAIAAGYVSLGPTAAHYSALKNPALRYAPSGNVTG